MTLDKEQVVHKMQERNFTVYASLGKSKIQFVSAHMYDADYIVKTPPRDRVPVINIIIDLDEDKFSGIYNVPGSINTLKTPECSSVMNDDHFDNIICKFEHQAKWLSRTVS